MTSTLRRSEGAGAPSGRHVREDPRKPGKFRPDIEGLRAFAVLSVVLYHAHLLGVHGGFVGVARQSIGLPPERWGRWRACHLPGTSR